MNLLLWIGNSPNQKALANKLANEFNIIGIVTETRAYQRKLTPKKLFNALLERLFLSSINKAWWEMNKIYNQQFPDYPKTTILDVENINGEEAYGFSKNLNPDLIIVSGTRLVKSKMLSIPAKLGILNLHTGLSPFVKGGPNCTNWCISTNQFHLVGNTIMWIDEGIDTGNIVTTEHTAVDWKSSLLQIHMAVMDHAHDLYLKAIRFLASGEKSSVPQIELGKGKTFYTKNWKLKNKFDLVNNHRNLNQKGKLEQIEQKKKDVPTVKISLNKVDSNATN